MDSNNAKKPQTLFCKVVSEEQPSPNCPVLFHGPNIHNNVMLMSQKMLHFIICET